MKDYWLFCDVRFPAYFLFPKFCWTICFKPTHYLNYYPAFFSISFPLSITLYGIWGLQCCLCFSCFLECVSLRSTLHMLNNCCQTFFISCSQCVSHCSQLHVAFPDFSPAHLQRTCLLKDCMVSTSWSPAWGISRCWGVLPAGTLHSALVWGSGAAWHSILQCANQQQWLNPCQQGAVYSWVSTWQWQQQQQCASAQVGTRNNE